MGNREKTGFTKTACLCLTAALIMGAAFTGCSTVSHVSKATVEAAKDAVEYIPYVGGPQVRFKRKAVLAPFENDTIFREFPVNKAFQDLIVRHFSESCPHLILVLPDDANFPESLSVAPKNETGRPDTMALVENGRQFGVNAIIAGGVLNLTLTEKEEGILWFREKEEHLRMQFSVEMFDTETGTKIFDDRFVHEIEDLEPEEIQAYKAGRPELFETVQEEIDELAEKMADKMCEAVVDLPWTGFVVSVVDNKAFLSFGADIGAKAGDVLDVFEKGEIIENYFKEKFIAPGKKIGQLELIQVDEDISVGRIPSEVKVDAGSTVKFPED